MKRIEQLVSDIAKAQGRATSLEQAIEMNLDSYYLIDHSSAKGGYRICYTSVDGGIRFGSFGESSFSPRRSLKLMTTFLEGVLYGLTFS